MRNFDANDQLQFHFLEFMITDPKLFESTTDIIDISQLGMYFNNRYRKVIELIKNRYVKYRRSPTSEEIKAKTGFNLHPRDTINEDELIWFLDEFEKWADLQR